MAESRKSGVRNYVLSILIVWAIAVMAFAANLFLVPHDTTPEIGAKGAFWLFLTLGSLPYFFVATLVGVAIFVGSSGRQGDA